MSFNKLAIVTIALISVAFCTEFKDKCPDKELIKPCTCHSNKFFTFVVTCHSIEDVKTIQKMNKHFKKDDRYDLKLVQPKFTYLPENFASELKIKEISFVDSRISEVSDKAFAGCEDKLEKIGFFGSKLSSIPNVKSLDKLFSLSIFNSTDLRDVTQKQADDLPKNLIQLILYSNDIYNISEGLFSKHEKLKLLVLARNHIKSIPKDSFPSSLDVIDLRRNNFKTIPVEAFKTFPNGCLLDLGGNSITTLPQSLIYLLNTKRQRIFLRDNPVECTCDTKWLARESGERTYEVYGKCGGNTTRKGVPYRYLTPYDFRECEQEYSE